MISTRSAALVIDTVVCLTLAKWETVSGRFGGYLRLMRTTPARRAPKGWGVSSRGRAANTHRPTTGLVPRAAFRIVMVLGPMLSNTGPRLDTRTRLRDGANDRIPSSTHRGRHVFGARHMQLQSGAPKWG